MSFNFYYIYLFFIYFLSNQASIGLGVAKIVKNRMMKLTFGGYLLGISVSGYSR